jgi:MoxR-like ATPase
VKNVSLFFGSHVKHGFLFFGSYVKTCVFGSHALFQALQVSAGALSELLTAVGTPEGGPTVWTLPTPLTTDQLRIVRQEALSTVQVPSHVIDLLVDLRTYLQELLEPPTYVSDRRMVKALELMKVRATTTGRLL